MFTVLSPRFKKIILFIAMLLGVSVTPFAHADAADACFNFLTPYMHNDYASAESEAKNLLRRNDLSRTEQRSAQLCLGRAYIEMGRTKDALPAFQQVEKLSRTTEELALAYDWLGSAYIHMDELDRAELYFQRERKAYKKLGNKSREAETINSLAGIAKERGNVERMLVLEQESLVLEPNEIVKPAKLRHIALIYADRQEYDKAVQMFRQAIDIERRHSLENTAVNYQIDLGDILRRQGKLHSAQSELTAGLDFMVKERDTVGQAKASGYLAELAVARNENSLARMWYKKAEELYRVIGDTDNADRIAKLLEGVLNFV